MLQAAAGVQGQARLTGGEASARSARDVVAAVVVVVAAEQLAVLRGSPAPAHSVVIILELVAGDGAGGEAREQLVTDD